MRRRTSSAGATHSEGAPGKLKGGGSATRTPLAPRTGAEGRLAPRAGAELWLVRALAVSVAIFCVFPLLFLLFLSVADGWTWPAVLPSGFRLDRWRAVLGANNELGRSLAISCALSATVAALSTAGGYLAGKFVARHPRRKDLLLLAYLPFALSPVILGACVLYLFIRIGIAGSFAGVVLAQTMVGFGFAVVFFDGFWSAEKKALEDLVRTLGGTERQLYRYVLLPLSRDVLLIGFFQTFLISWFQYGLTLLVGSGKIQTLSIKVYDYVAEANVSYAAVSSCLLVVPPVLLLWANRRILYKAV